MNKFKEILSRIGVFLIIIGLVYGFLTICNWGYNPMDWNGFSRVLLGIFVVVPLTMFLDDYR